MNWTDCPDVEIIPGKQAGSPLVKGTRIPVQQIIEEWHMGRSIAEVARDYELAPERVERLIEFGKRLAPVA
jgi:uncharacterized protein (DUF433 family)